MIVVINKMILPFCLSPVVISAYSDKHEPSPIYTTLADGSKVEIMFDLKSYAIAISIGIPLFLLMVAIHFSIRFVYEVYQEKHKRPVRRDTNMGLYSVNTTTSPKRHRLYEA
jgi:hypothetical protein